MDTSKAEDQTPEQYAARVDRTTNDPDRIEKRKGIAPGMTVPRG